MFKKHTKKIMAVFGVLLMIAFLLPSQLQNLIRHGDPVVGHLDGKRVKASELRPWAVRMSYLDALVFLPGENATAATAAFRIPIFQTLLGDSYQAYRRDVVPFWLLMNEVESTGHGVTDEDIDSVLAGNVPLFGRGTLGLNSGDGNIATVPTMSLNEKRGVRAAVRDLLLITKALETQASMIRPTLPQADALVARQFQQLSVKLVEVPVQPLITDVPEPSEGQLGEHLARFGRYQFGQVTADNPFGFGYAVPDRVKLETIRLPFSAVREIVKASKTDTQWEEAAAIYYVKHESDFKESEVQPPRTEPATRPFDSVKQTIINKLIDDATAERIDAIVRRLRSRVEGDRESLLAHQITSTSGGSSQSTSSLGVEYTTFAYLERLADDIQKTAGVRPTITSHANRFLRQAEVASLPEVGFATFNEGVVRELTFAEYVFGTLRPLLNEDERRQVGELVLEVNQISRPLVDTVSRDRVLFRVTEVDPAHAQDKIDPIRNELIEDVKLTFAFERARQSAQQQADASAAAGELVSMGNPILGPFECSAQNLPLMQLSIVRQEAAMQFFDSLTQTLLDSNNTAGFGVVAVPAARKVFVAQRVGVTGLWNDARQLDQFRVMAVGTIRSQAIQRSPALRAMFDIDRLYRRANYVPERRPTDEDETGTASL